MWIEQRGFDQRTIGRQRQDISEGDSPRRIVGEVHQLDAAGIEDRPLADQFLAQERLPQRRVTVPRRAGRPGVDHLCRCQAPGRGLDAPATRHWPGRPQYRHARLKPNGITGCNGPAGVVVESTGFEHLVRSVYAGDMHCLGCRTHCNLRPAAPDESFVAVRSQAPETPAAIVGVSRARLEHHHPPATAGLFRQPQRQAQPRTATAEHDEVEISLQRQSPWPMPQRAWRPAHAT